MVSRFQRNVARAALLLWVGVGVSQPLACNAGGEVRSVSQAEAIAYLESDSPPLFLDTRTEGEFVNGHVPGAINIPHDQVAARMDEILARRERLIVVYCQRGGRAGKAIDVLRAQGVEHLGHLEGDMSAWLAKGLPVEQ